MFRHLYLGFGIFVAFFFLGYGFTYLFEFPSLVNVNAQQEQYQSCGPVDTNSDLTLGIIDLADFASIYLRTCGTTPTDLGACRGKDINGDDALTIIDFSDFSQRYLKDCTGANPTQPPTTSTPTQPPTTSSPTTNPTAGPTIPFSQQQGIWISTEEIMALPTSGSAWDDVLSAANSSWGSADLGNNDSSHDVDTLAGALVAIRNSDDAMRNKVINEGLNSAMNSSLDRALELSRGLQTYIIAADIIGYRTPEFEAWVREMLETKVSPHNSGSNCNSQGQDSICNELGGVTCTAVASPNNWGGHARASLAAGALYLNDPYYIDLITNAEKAFVGENVPNYLVCKDTNWHADSEKFGVNKKGSKIGETFVSGVLPEDWRRAADYKWPPSESGYMWEGMQGYVVTAVILHRAGLVPFDAGENAVVRSMDMLYGTGEAANNSPVFTNPASGDDTWIPWVVNYYAGTNFPTSAATSGKNMGYTDWTHKR